MFEELEKSNSNFESIVCVKDSNCTKWGRAEVLGLRGWLEAGPNILEISVSEDPKESCHSIKGFE